jgi:Ras-related protein Rab-6A
VDKWVEDVRNERGNEVIIFLVGNKIDLSEGRVVSAEDSATKAKALNVTFVETSAKGGINIKSLFRQIAQELPGMRDVELGNSDFGDTVYITPHAQAKKSASGNCKC